MPGASDAEANRRGVARSSVEWLADSAINSPTAHAEKKQTTSPYEKSLFQLIRGGSIMPATGIFMERVSA